MRTVGRIALFGAILVTVLLATGCATGGEGKVAYLSLADRSMVTVDKQGTWSGPHPLSLREPSGEGRVVTRGRVTGLSGGAFLTNRNGELWIQGGGLEGGIWTDDAGSKELLDIIEVGGDIEVFPERLSDRLGLGGLGV